MDKMVLTEENRIPTQGHTSKGDQPKWQADGKWYKADHMGYEGLSEVVISRLLEKSNVSDFVSYSPILIQSDEQSWNGCVSQNFQQSNEMLIPFERLHRAYKGVGLSATLGKMPDAISRIRYTIDFVEETTGLRDVGPYLTMLLELDSFFLNEDRHTNNLAVIRNETTKQFRLCPVFDNGLSLLSDINDYPPEQDIYDCIEKVAAKPFSLDFNEQIEAAEELFGLRLKFFFTKKDVSEALDFATEMYGEEIAQRVERVLLEQMRKWKIYF